MANLHLIAHDAFAIFSALVMIFIIIILLINNHKSTVNITLALTMVAVIFFEVSHVWGVSVSDPVLSTKILMWNLSVIFICMFNFHCAMAALKKHIERSYMVYLIYLVGTSLIIFYIIFPETFILQSEPLKYFPNYYVAGSFHYVMRVIFQIIIPIFFIVELSRAYLKEKDLIEKNRIIYFTLGLCLGWGFGVLPVLPIFGIWTDPMYGVLFPVVFAIPFTYAVLQYELLDIRVVAKKAFAYGVSIAGVGTFISLLLLTDDYIKAQVPGYPFWATPLISALIAVVIGVMAWHKLREGDMMKYEFITTVTHKFRTPLTYIRWAAENIKTAENKKDQEEQVKYIITANQKLVELTDILANVSEVEKSFAYTLERRDLYPEIEDVIQNLSNEAKTKNITIEKSLDKMLKTSFDDRRLKFVIQVFIENAINYTPVNGTISVSATTNGKNIVFSVKDTGIGLSKEDISVLFSKFYRGHKARVTDTEGMGIGLYISKKIIAKHKGHIWVQSEGPNKGSTFSFSIPVA